jgi:hypothetical protein
MKPVAATAAVFALLAAASARADVGIVLDRTAARPGDGVRATSASCCYLSLYLVPVQLVPKRTICRLRNGSPAGCEPWSIGPPHRAGWVWIGRFFPRRPSFVFRVPRLRRGLYRPVVYCPPCYRGRRGSLIAGSGTLRIQ